MDHMGHARADAMFCPACSGPVVAVIGIVVDNDHQWPMPIVTREKFLVCICCPIATQVDWETGRLRNLPNMTLRTLDAPFVPGIDPKPALRSFSTYLHGRKDS